MSTEEATAYTKKDFMSDQTIRWCRGVVITDPLAGPDGLLPAWASRARSSP